MSTHRQFTIEAEDDFQITLEIDLRVMTPETAAEVNSYLDESERVLLLANGDAVRAVAIRAALFLLVKLFIGLAGNQALAALGEAKGWPRNHGITILDFYVPGMDLHFFQVTKESAR